MKPKPINVHDAKTHFSRLLARVERGTEVVIARDGKPVARLVPYAQAHKVPLLGADEGRFVVPEDFDAPLPAEVISSFEGD